MIVFLLSSRLLAFVEVSMPTPRVYSIVEGVFVLAMCPPTSVIIQPLI